MPFRGSSTVSDTDTTATDGGDSPHQTYRGEKVKHRRTSRGEPVSSTVRLPTCINPAPGQLAISAEKLKADATILVTALCHVVAASCLVMVSVVL